MAREAGRPPAPAAFARCLRVLGRAQGPPPILEGGGLPRARARALSAGGLTPGLQRRGARGAGPVRDPPPPRPRQGGCACWPCGRNCASGGSLRGLTPPRLNAGRSQPGTPRWPVQLRWRRARAPRARLAGEEAWPPSIRSLEFLVALCRNATSLACYVSHLRSALRLVQAPLGALAVTSGVTKGAAKAAPPGERRFRARASAAQAGRSGPGGVRRARGVPRRTRGGLRRCAPWRAGSAMWPGAPMSQTRWLWPGACAERAPRRSNPPPRLPRRQAVLSPVRRRGRRLERARAL